MKPSVDVIIPCFNYGRMLEACVTSVLSQAGVEVRAIVMDDASTDETSEVGRRLWARDSRVVYRRHELNLGHIATYNEALDKVIADYCLILSADDMLTPGALERVTAVMEAHPNVGLAYGRDIPFRGDPPEFEPRPSTRPPRVIGYIEFLREACRLGHTGIQSPTAVVRTSLHRRIGMYLPELPHSGDTEIWLRMAAEADVAEIDADQAFRRLHSANMSLGYSPLSRLLEQVRAFDTHFDAHAGSRPEIRPLRQAVYHTIGEGAFWSATRAFDRGASEECDEFLAFAERLAPELTNGTAWRRFKLKRMVGPSVWRGLAPIASIAKGILHPGATKGAAR